MYALLESIARKMPPGLVDRLAPMVLALLRTRSPRDFGRFISGLGWRPVRPNKEVPRLLASGLFDAKFYGAQVGVRFGDATAAATHFVTRRSAGRYSPHPLISLAVFPSRERAQWRSGGVPAMLSYLSSKAGLGRPWGPLFDPRDVVADVDDAGGFETVVAHIAGLEESAPLTLSSIVAQANTASTLPTTSWGAFRAELCAAAERIQSQQVLAQPIRPATSWDAKAEARWLAALPEPASHPMVSIVMPAWNRATIIGRAIESVRAQTYENWELLVVDDGSTDDTRDVVHAIGEKDPRVRLFTEGHRGAAAARNVGLREARGKLVAFLDSDNTWLPGFLQTMVAAMTKDDLSVAYSAIRLWEGRRKPRYRGVPVDLELLKVRNQVDMNVLVADLALVREVGGFDESLRKLIDFDLVIRLAARTSLVLLPFIGAEYEAGYDDPHRITLSALDSYRWKVHEKALVDWAVVRQAVPQRTTGRTSVVMLASGERGSALETLRTLLATTHGEDVEVVIVDNGLSMDRSLALEAAALAIPGARYTRLARAFGVGVAYDVGISLSTGEYIVLLDPGAQWRSGRVSDLVAPLAHPTVRGVQALLLDEHDRVLSAGTRLLGSERPDGRLHGRPARDARQLAGVVQRAVSGRALAMRAAEVVELLGLDSVFVGGTEAVDLCLRAVDAYGGGFVVAPDVVVSFPAAPVAYPLRAPGDDVDSWPLLVERRGGDIPVEPATVVAPPADGALRWGLKNLARAGLPGDAWGDTYFLEDLTHALEEQGQQVAEHRRQVHKSAATHLDDVALALRGIMRIQPQRDATNVLWVISHPEDVSAAELRQFDLVYAASEPWAKRMSERHGITVRPLLQATNPLEFSPRRETQLPGIDAPVLFVGQARPTAPRKIVMDAIQGGVDRLEVWGPHWSGKIPARYLAGEWIANHQLGRAYQAARVVLADHHADMARDGFVANRLFDAVACGARVVCDQVEGAAEIFHGAVQIYESPEHLAWLVSEEGLREAFPSDERMAEISREVGREHNFAARARTLIDDVRRFRAGQ